MGHHLFCTKGREVRPVALERMKSGKTGDNEGAQPSGGVNRALLNIPEERISRSSLAIPQIREKSE